MKGNFACKNNAASSQLKGDSAILEVPVSTFPIDLSVRGIPFFIIRFMLLYKNTENVCLCNSEVQGWGGEEGYAGV